MKFASLLIDMNFIGQAEPQSAQRKDTFLLPLREGKRKRLIATRYFWILNALRACFLLFSGVPVPLSGVNGKQ
jgi:hypothetical protein